MKKGIPTSIRLAFSVEKRLRAASKRVGLPKTLLIEGAVKLYLDDVLKKEMARFPLHPVKTHKPNAHVREIVAPHVDEQPPAERIGGTDHPA